MPIFRAKPVVLALESSVDLEKLNNSLCPVVIDDVLNGLDIIHDDKPHAFKLLGKLGRVPYSTVWLRREM